MTEQTQHTLQRVRREPKRRRLTVERVTALSPKMRRIDFVSPELTDFESLSPDDHIKLFVPDASEPRGEAMRDYTPRAFDAALGRLTIDFALHQAGPATAWALAAKPSDAIDIGGPRGSFVVADDFDHYLLVGDETALPSIARRLETLRANVPVTTIIVVDSPAEAQAFATRADLTAIWVTRADDGRDDAARLQAALESWQAPAGDGYVWIAAEGAIARRLREYMLNTRGQPKAWLKASGYWVRGKAGESEKFEG